jgi:hypothetical protein
MMPDSWLEYMRNAEKDIKRPPATPKRRMPRVTRMESERMRRVGRQTINPIRAMYGQENEQNSTPTKPEEWRGTLEVGPNCEFNSAVDWRTGKETTSHVTYRDGIEQ